MTNNPDSESVSRTIRYSKLPGEILPIETISESACPWLDKYVIFSQKWSPRSYESYHEAVGLWVLSTVAARRVAYDFGKTRYTNLYLLLVGRTSLMAKSTAAQIGKAFIEAANLDFLLIPDNCTPQRFVSEFTEDEEEETTDDKKTKKNNKNNEFVGQRGWYYDEFGMLISGMMQKNGIMSDFRGLLRKFDDTEKQYETATIMRGKETIHYPYLSLVGCMTPADLLPYARTGSALWGDGFFARFGFVFPPPEFMGQGRFPRGERKIPVALVTDLTQWHKRLGNSPSSIKNKAMTPETPTAKKLLVSQEVDDAFYLYHDALMNLCQTFPVHDLDGNYGRFPEKALRIAALFASLGKAEEIKIEHWAKAIDIVERWREGTHNLYNFMCNNSVSAPSNQKDRVLKAIASKGSPTQREIAQNTGLLSEQIEKQINDLMSAGRIEGIESGKTTRYRITTQAKVQSEIPAPAAVEKKQSAEV
jgi:hypothetical protein